MFHVKKTVFHAADGYKKLFYDRLNVINISSEEEHKYE